MRGVRSSARPHRSARMARLVCVVLATLSALIFPASSWAAPHLEVSTHASNDHPTVGEPFEVEMTIKSDEPLGPVSSPAFSGNSAFSVSGPSVSTRMSMSVINGVPSTRSDIALRWNLTPTAPGTFTLAGPSVSAGGQQLQGSPLKITVGGSAVTPGGPDYSPAQDVDDQGIVKNLVLDNGPTDEVFLHATVDKSSAVVGEQVTVSFYVYFRVDFTMTEHKEAALADFLRIPLLTDPSTTVQQTTTVNGKRYGVRLIDRVAAFPLKAGKLHTGTVSARFTGRKIGADVEKVSDEAVVNVSEPPEAGRPPGFVTGSVGKLSLEATVPSRQTQAGGTIAVMVTVKGQGNIPLAIKMPQQVGVEEWSDPQRHDAIVTTNDKVAGSRTFAYVVTLKQAGAFDLGTVELPFFDPSERAYHVATVALGTVDVKPAVLKQEAGDDSQQPDDLLAKLPRARLKLSPYEHPESRGLPMWGLGSAIAFPPLLVGFGFAASSIGRRIVRRRKAARESGATKVREALAAAKAAEKKGDVKELAAAVERSVHAAIEDATGLKSRGVMRDALAGELQGRGVAKEKAAEIGDLLAQCELMRFTPAADAETMAGLVARAAGVAKTLRPSAAA